MEAMMSMSIQSDVEILSVQAVASFPLAQPAQTRINTGLFKKSKDN